MSVDLRAQRLSLGYEKGPNVVSEVDIEIPPGEITSIIGANGCGKSTLLRALARLMAPREGVVLLDGQSIHSQNTKEVARKIGLLPQGPTVPDGILVEDLVSRGRYPHQHLLQQWSHEDEAAVEHALMVTQTDGYRERLVDELSGGQRQRVWIALALAQETPTLLLDEPTTFLDLAHQLDILSLLVALNKSEDRTIVLVLHDINQAARYSHHIIAMRDGEIVKRGTPLHVITEKTVDELYGISSVIITDPLSGTPLCVPEAADLPPIPQRAPPKKRKKRDDDPAHIQGESEYWEHTEEPERHGIRPARKRRKRLHISYE